MRKILLWQLAVLLVCVSNARAAHAGNFFRQDPADKYRLIMLTDAQKKNRLGKFECNARLNTASYFEYRESQMLSPITENIDIDFLRAPFGLHGFEVSPHSRHRFIKPGQQLDIFTAQQWQKTAENKPSFRSLSYCKIPEYRLLGYFDKVKVNSNGIKLPRGIRRRQSRLILISDYPS